MGNQNMGNRSTRNRRARAGNREIKQQGEGINREKKSTGRRNQQGKGINREKESIRMGKRINVSNWEIEQRDIELQRDGATGRWSNGEVEEQRGREQWRAPRKRNLETSAEGNTEQVATKE